MDNPFLTGFLNSVLAPEGSSGVFGADSTSLWNPMMAAEQPSWMTPEIALKFARDPDGMAKQAADWGVPPPRPPAPRPVGAEFNPHPAEIWPPPFHLEVQPAVPGAKAAPLPEAKEVQELTVAGEPTESIPSNAQPAMGATGKGVPRPMTPGEKLLDALKGVRAPAPPELQRLGTPAAPRPTAAIKGGELLALLQMLQGGSGQKAPVSLGAALGR